jgi:uncharacterized membrane protein HdeD (DUF308 family)
MNTSSAKPLSSIPWWLVLLQGILSVLVGILLLTSPGVAVLVLVRLLGWYWLIKGIFSLTAVFHPEAKAHRGWLIFNSVLGIVAGIVVLDHPLISAIFVPAVVVTIIGIAGLLIGFNDLFAAFRGAGWSMGLLGVISILLGGALLFNTVIGVALLPYFIGVVEVLGGLIAFVVALKLRAAPASAR